MSQFDPGPPGAVPPVPPVPPGPPVPRLGQVPVPPTRTAPPPRRAPSGRSVGRLVGILLVLGLGALAVWFVSSSLNPLKETDEVSADDPAAPVLAWWEAMAKRDTAAACKVMSAEAIERQEKLGGRTCAAELLEQNRGDWYSDGYNVIIEDQVVKGDKAEIAFRFKGSPMGNDYMLVVREGGVWKLDYGGDANGIEPCKTEQRMVVGAVAAYYAERQQIPPDVQALVQEGYLDEVPKNTEILTNGSVELINDCA